MSKTTWLNNEEIQIFQEYLRIRSVHPNVDYEPCVKFLQRQAQSLQLPINIHYMPSKLKKPIVVITWTGTKPEQKSILLNSHMDVVPVFDDLWTHDPFGAEIDENGRIYGRGTQDMKCVGTWYLAAIRALIKDGIRLRRTVHVVFVPDEEIGSEDGWMKFVKTDDFQHLNVGFALDEGCAEPDDIFSYFYTERTNRCVQFKCNGSTGHGSYFHDDAAGPKAQYIIDKVMKFQHSERMRLVDNPALDVAEVTTVNLTMLNGGTQSNVLPSSITIVFDLRVAIDVNLDEFENRLKRWAREAGKSVEIEFLEYKAKIAPTPIDGSDPFVTMLQKTLRDELKFTIKSFICPARTDANIIRAAGIPAIGFTPMRKTPRLLHANDEYIRVDTYLEGIDVYKHLIKNLANV